MICRDFHVNIKYGLYDLEIELFEQCGFYIPPIMPTDQLPRAATQRLIELIVDGKAHGKSFDELQSMVTVAQPTVALEVD